MEFHEKLVELRRGNHMTQQGLASALGVTRQTVYKWETGQSYPEAMTLFAMRSLFNVPTDVLLDNTVSLADYQAREVECEAEIAHSTKEANNAAPAETAAAAQENEGAQAGDGSSRRKSFLSRLLGK